MIESEGITEEVKTWRTDVVADIARDVGIEKVIFEAANPEVFGWVHQEVRPGGQPVRPPLADRPARVSPARNLGHEEPLGARADLGNAYGGQPGFRE